MRATIVFLSCVTLGVAASAAESASPSIRDGAFQGLAGIDPNAGSAPSLAGTNRSLGTTTVSGAIGLKESPPILPEMIERHGDAVRKMLVAITNADFPGFLFQGDQRFQTFERAKFNALAQTWGSQLAAGFGTTFLGELKRKSAATTLWRVRLNNKGGDVLVIVESNSRGSVSDIVLF